MRDFECERKYADCDEFEVLFTLVEAYEENIIPFPPPHPIHAIKFSLEQGEADEKELAKIQGARSFKFRYYPAKKTISK